MHELAVAQSDAAIAPDGEQVARFLLHRPAGRPGQQGGPAKLPAQQERPPRDKAIERPPQEGKWVQDGQGELLTYRLPFETAGTLTFSADGRRLPTARGGTITIWDVDVVLRESPERP